MQSFRERSSGYHSNQPCYQQEPHELSRLDTYRQHPHHPQPQHPHPGPGPHPVPGHTRSGYEAHSLANPTGITPAVGPGNGVGPKDCYSQQAYPGYAGNVGENAGGNGGSAPPQAKKPYRGSKVPSHTSSQHLQGPGGYSNHLGPGNYSAQYLSEGHLQQKWEDPVQLTQYDQDLVARIEAGGGPAPGSSQYIDQNVLGHSQSQCHQPSNSAYTSPHHQSHAPNPAPSPLMYPQSHLHYPQPSPSPSPYMEKCNAMPHCYKGYSLTPNSQYSRQMGSHSNLKQGNYRSTQNNYAYQQPPSRGYEPQPPLQAMTNPQETHPKYQHYSQNQQNYCLSELSVRSPEQYYQTCSPSSSHSPARSVGRSPSYSSTPSPLMSNPESFQYGQPPMTPTAASATSSSSAGLQEQSSSNTMLMPPRSHASPSVPHSATHSFATTPHIPSMKERFSEKLLSNPSLWSLNALTSQVESISNNVQQLLLSEALVANKKGSKRSSGGSNGSAGNVNKKGEEYKTSLYPDGGIGSIGGGPIQDPYSTTQQQVLPMELHEGGYSSSSDEQLERGYYFCGQGRSPAQAPNNTQLNLDTASSCSITSPDDMSTRSGDSSLHNLTPDPIRCQSGQGRDGMNTPVKSIGEERSPASINVLSPMKQDSDSPSDIQHINEPIKENFEESALTEKFSDKEEMASEKTPDHEKTSDTTNLTEDLEKWSEDENLYCKVNKDIIEKSYCYDETVYQKIPNKYDPTLREPLEPFPAALSDSSQNEHFDQAMKSEPFKAESPCISESSVKTLPFTSRSFVDQDQYSTEKEDSSENMSPAPHIETFSENNSNNQQNRAVEDEEDEEDGQRVVVTDETEEEDIHKQQHPLSPPLSAEVRKDVEDEEEFSDSLTVDHMNNTDEQEMSSDDLCSRTESQIIDLHADNDFATGPLTYQNATSAVDACERASAIGDTAPQPQSALPVFSALNDRATPPAQSRDHIDHSDAKVLEPDSPQIPGKSILPSAPSWADTPPSPKKGDEDVEPGISCSSAVTPMAKAEPLVLSAQPRTYGRKYTRGKRRIMQTSVGITQEIHLERDEGQEEENVPSPVQKHCMPPSKTVLLSDQTDLTHQESIVSQTPKQLSDGLRTRMCTRSFNAPDMPPKVELNVKRKHEPKSGSKPGPKSGPKIGTKPSPKEVTKPDLKPGSKLGPKPGPTQSQKPVPIEPELPPKIETPVKRKPGPKPGLKPESISVVKPESKSGLKPGLKPGPKPASKPAKIWLTTNIIPNKASVGRPKGSISKTKLTQKEESIQPLSGFQSRSRKNQKTTILQVNQEVRPLNKVEKQANEDKESEKDGKNMVLRSRKPSLEKVLKEREKIIETDVVPQTQTEIKPSSVSPKDKDPVTAEQKTSSVPCTDMSTDVSMDSPAQPELPVPPRASALIDKAKDKVSLPLKRKSSVEAFPIPGKKRRGPKPKSKSLPPQPFLEVQTTSKPKEKSVQEPKRKQEPSKKPSLSPAPTKDTLHNNNDADILTDVPPLPPQCPTKTKVLPPRKGRGQKYTAMVQKITSPGSKKHFPLPSIDSSFTDDLTIKTLPQHKEGEISMFSNTVEMIEEKLKSTESTQGEVGHCLWSKEADTKGRGMHVCQETAMLEEEKQYIVEDDVAKETKSENTEDIIQDKEEAHTGALVNMQASDKLIDRASAGVSVPTKSTRTKRKRWAMVESTDASVAALEAGSLIVTTPRLAKQRAIKNNHEMHLKQRRKKRKYQTPIEGIEAAKDTNTETAEPQATEEKVEEKLTSTEEIVLLPISQDEITESLEVTDKDLLQKPRRGRKPSANPTKKKCSKASSEHIPGKPMKVHKKPGPKPGMKDALEVIEAVIRAAGCEQAEKEEKENEKRQQRQQEEQEKQEPCVVGPVVTITEKQTEIITVKRIRRKPVQKYSKLSFCPYVRINNSRDFSSWCTVINKPEDAVTFQKRKKKGIVRMKNPITVAKVVPHTPAMLQGPLVNKDLFGRCLTCCLCRKPSNYRDLGDLCGPYYTEDDIPRKILTNRHTGSLREFPTKSNDNSSSCDEKPSSSSGNEVEGSNPDTSIQERNRSRHHHWRYRRSERAERVCQEGRPQRVTLQERFRKMKQLQAISQGASSDQESSMFQKLQVEAEAKEHWAHENCAIWTKGVIMVAGRLYGLKEAANKSAEVSCYKCQIVGASLSCCWRGCSHKYHYVCAKEIGCTFHDDDFSIKCPKHEDL